MITKKEAPCSTAFIITQPQPVTVTAPAARTLRDIIPSGMAMMATVSCAHRALADIKNDGHISEDRKQAILSAQRVLFLNSCAEGGDRFDPDKTVEQIEDDLETYMSEIVVESLPKVQEAMAAYHASLEAAPTISPIA